MEFPAGNTPNGHLVSVRFSHGGVFAWQRSEGGVSRREHSQRTPCVRPILPWGRFCLAKERRWSFPQGTLPTDTLVSVRFPRGGVFAWQRSEGGVSRREHSQRTPCVRPIPPWGRFCLAKERRWSFPQGTLPTDTTCPSDSPVGVFIGWQRDEYGDSRREYSNGHNVSVRFPRGCFYWCSKGTNMEFPAGNTPNGHNVSVRFTRGGTNKNTSMRCFLSNCSR